MFTATITTPNGVIGNPLATRNLRFSWNKNGAYLCTYSMNMLPAEQNILFSRPKNAMVEVWNDGGLVWRGRLTGVNMEDEAVVVTAHGLQFDLDRVLAPHFWVKTGTRDFVFGTNQGSLIFPFLPNRSGEKFYADNNNRLYIALIKNNVYGVNDQASFFLLPTSGFGELASSFVFTRPVSRFKLSYSMLLPPGWQVVFEGRHIKNMPDAENNNAFHTVVATGILQTATIDISITPKSARRYTFGFTVSNNTGSDYTHSGETGSMYVSVTNVQVLTCEDATCRAIEIARDMTQLNASFMNNGLKFNGVDQGIDLENEDYADISQRQVLDRLAKYGDTSNREYNWWVDVDDTLHFRPRKSFAYDFLALDGKIALNRDGRQEHTVFYGVYQNQMGYPFRTPFIEKTPLESLVHDRAMRKIETNTTSATTAEKIVTTVATAPWRNNGRIVCRGILSANGASYPFWQLRHGDTIAVAPNYIYDEPQVASFDVDGWEYDADSDTLTVYPDAEMADVPSMIAGL